MNTDSHGTPGTNGTYFAAFDGNGNAVGLLRSTNGAVTAAYEYDPFGNTLRATGAMANEFRSVSARSTGDNPESLHSEEKRWRITSLWSDN